MKRRKAKKGTAARECPLGKGLETPWEDWALQASQSVGRQWGCSGDKLGRKVGRSTKSLTPLLKVCGFCNGGEGRAGPQ